MPSQDKNARTGLLGALLEPIGPPPDATAKVLSHQGYVDEGGWKHRYVDLEIRGLSESTPSARLDLPAMAITKLTHLQPQPLGWHGSVVWDGDCLAPRLLFDGWPDGIVKVRLEVLGR